MIKFNSISDALHYRKKCPICLSELLFYNRANEISIIDNSIFIEYFYLNHMIYESDICVNILNNKIESFNGKASESLSFIGDSDRINSSLSIECHECGQYDYVVKLYLNNNSVEAVLNSESITFNDDPFKDTYQIYNLYPTKETQVIQFSTNKEDRFSSLPLIKLDIENLEHTINRIKKLLIFS